MMAARQENRLAGQDTTEMNCTHNDTRKFLAKNAAG